MLRKFASLATVLMAAGFLVVGCSDDDSATCGDGVMEGSEVCDGTDLGTNTCVSEGLGAGTLGCNLTCDGFDTSMCGAGDCGDGEISGTEECDGANLNSQTCEGRGFDSGTLACDPTTCQFDESACVTDCNDGTLQTDEVCDGADLNGADCTTESFDGGVLACNSTCDGYDTTGCCDDGCPTENDTQCTGDVLNTCTMGTNGCLDWVDTNCANSGETCDDSGDPAVCSPGCSDECTVDGETTCDATGNLNLCSDSDSNGCLDITITDCSLTGGFCDNSVSPAVCTNQGGGDTCADAIVITQAVTTFSGTDFTVDFPNDDHDFSTGTDCSNVSSSGGGIDAVFQVDLQAGDELIATDDAAIDFVIHIVAADAVNCLDTTVCQDSIDGNETTGAYYLAAAAETVYVVYEKYYASTTGSNEYDLTINHYSVVCGDGHVSPTETCDDGNTATGDGCDASCAVETGYECVGSPSFCYPTGTGDICGTGTGGPAIPLTAPAMISFDTSAFTDDYGDQVGTDYTACGGDGGWGPDAVFSVDVPSGEILDVTMSNQTFNAALVLTTDCADVEGTCVFYEEGSSGTHAGSYTNTTGSAQTIYIVADCGNSFSACSGTFDLGVSLRTPVCGDGLVDGTEACDDGNIATGDGCDASCAVEAGFDCGGAPSFCYPTGSGDTCANPIVLPGTISLSADTSTFANDYTGAATYDGGACSTFGSANAPDMAFEITLLDGETATVAVTGESYDALIALTTDCSTNTACLDLGDDPENVTYTNSTGATQTIYLLIDGYSTASGTYDLSVTIN